MKVDPTATCKVTKRRSSWACIGNPKLEQETIEGTHAQETPDRQRRPTTLHEGQKSTPQSGRNTYVQGAGCRFRSTHVAHAELYSRFLGAISIDKQYYPFCHNCISHDPHTSEMLSAQNRPRETCSDAHHESTAFFYTQPAVESFRSVLDYITMFLDLQPLLQSPSNMCTHLFMHAMIGHLHASAM